MSLVAAVYARKSTDQERGETGDSFSVEKQIVGARAFIAERGWTVGAIFKDEAVSGWTVPLDERTGGKALLVAARTRSFNVLVMRNETRLGREMADSLHQLVTLIRGGVRIFYTATGQEVTLRTAKEKLLASIGHFSAGDYAEKVSGDTRRGKLKRARQGRWQCGRVYGYRNVDGKLVIEEPEAKVIRQVFTLVAQGLGMLRIAKQIGKPVTTIRCWLKNDLFRGVARYNGKRDDGTVETVEIQVPAIINETLWAAAHKELERHRQVHPGIRKANGQLTGYWRHPGLQRHLLTGFMACGECGAKMFVVSRVRTGGKVRLYWLCTSFHKQGHRACTNRYFLPYDPVQAAVLARFKPEVLREAVQEFLMERCDRPDVAPEDELETARAEVARLDEELARLVAAVKAGGASIPSLVTALRTTQAARDEAAARVEGLEGAAQGDEFDEDDAAEELRLERLPEASRAALGPLSAADPATARLVLRDLIPEPIRVVPVVEGSRVVAWELGGQADLGKFLAGQIRTATTPQRPTA